MMCQMVQRVIEIALKDVLNFDKRHFTPKAVWRSCLNDQNFSANKTTIGISFALAYSIEVRTRNM